MNDFPFKRLARRIKRGCRTGLSAKNRLLAGSPNRFGNILDDYVTSAPSDQNAVDIFKGQWSSSFPVEAGHLEAGDVGLFEDMRMAWGGEKIGGFKDLSVLELGPLEAGHTYMLEKGGARSILSIEANARAYLKCLVVKEVYNLRRARFLLGDFLGYLRDTDQTFDICVANGVLYHMREPAELIYLISKASDKAIIWTHYFDEAAIQGDQEKARHFSEIKNHDFRGFKYKTYKYSYLDALGGSGFCGGTAPFSRWMLKEDILACLSHFGFNNIDIGFDDLQTGNGPSFCLACSK